MIKSIKKYVSFILVLIFTVSMISGCSKPSEKPVENNNNVQTNESASITVTDQIGREVEITDKVSKIVSSYYISSSLLIALGLKDNVVGIEMKADTREIYKRAAPEFLNLPAVGSGKGINVEEIAKLDPDLVIIPLKLKDSVTQLEELNIPVLVIDPETLENFIQCIDIISKATGTEERGAEIIKYYNDTIRSISEKTNNIDNKPSVYLSSGSDFFRTCTSKMYQNDLINMAGGDNVSAGLEDGYWQTVSAEEVLNWNPKYIFIVSYAEYSSEDIINNDKLLQVDAVANENIFTFPSLLEPWDYPTPSSVLGILWLTNKLHPEIYSTDDYIKEAVSFYKEYYGIDVSDADMGL